MADKFLSEQRYNDLLRALTAAQIPLNIAAEVALTAEVSRGDLDKMLSELVSQIGDRCKKKR
jgi:hypothetical protein